MALAHRHKLVDAEFLIKRLVLKFEEALLHSQHLFVTFLHKLSKANGLLLHIRFDALFSIFYVQAQILVARFVAVELVDLAIHIEHSVLNLLLHVLP